MNLNQNKSLFSAGAVYMKSPDKEGGFAEIDIEGVIGVPESSQFHEPGRRVATYERFSECIDEIRRLGTSQVVINIRSCGGNVNDALLIYESVKSLNAEITTRCYGYVASAATIIAQAADEGKRELSSNSLYLIHRSRCESGGDAEELARDADMLQQTDVRIAALYAARSGRAEADFETLMAENRGAGRWISPQEAVELGLADTIIDPVKLTRKDKRTIVNLGLPKLPSEGTPKNLTRIWRQMTSSTPLAKENDNSTESGQTDEFPLISPTDTNETETVNVPPSTDLPAVPEDKPKTIAENIFIADLRLPAPTDPTDELRRTASATTTKRREDPSYHDRQFKSNDSAYMADVRNFK